MLWSLFTESEKQIVPFFIFISLFYVILSHELSHLLVVFLAKWELKAFRPYPHRHLRTGSWIGGAVYYEHHDKNMEYMPFMLCAPLWKSFIVFLFWIFVAFKFYLPLIAFAIVEFSDYCSWWFGYIFRRTNSDGWKFRWLQTISKFREK